MTIGFKSNDRGGIRSTEKWEKSGAAWGNHLYTMLETSIGPLLNCSHSHGAMLSQSMSPQMIGSAEHQALVQSFVRLNSGRMLENSSQHENGSPNTFLKSRNSSSQVNSTSEMSCLHEDHVGALENNLHISCISSLGRGNNALIPGLTNTLDRTKNGDAPYMASHRYYKNFYPMESPTGPLSSRSLPSSEREKSYDGVEGRVLAVAGLQGLVEGDDEDWKVQEETMIHESSKLLQKQQQSEKHPVFQESIGGFIETMSTAGITATCLDRVKIPAAIHPPPPPFLLRNDGVGVSPSVDLDNFAEIQAILIRQASQPVPTLEEIASSRPKRRNVRISKDTQSVAARHRRERISDRIRVLQRLVPGGTKMDTASMLDEAIHYVKFLKRQLQTLEQLGNNGCNPGDAAQQADGDIWLSSFVRPAFHLNRTSSFQSWPAPVTNLEILS